MAESKEKTYRSVCDEPVGLPADASFSVAELSSVLTKSHEELAKKQDRRNWKLVHTGLIVNSCGLLFVLFLWWQHQATPGHHISYGNTISNENRIKNIEAEQSKVARVMEKAEENEKDVKAIRADLQKIKLKLGTE